MGCPKPDQPGAATAIAAPVPLAAHPQGQQMMAQAAQNAALLDIDFKFLNKTYKNDQYTRVAGQKIRTACVRFKATSGFKFRVGAPQFTLTTQGLTIEQKISKLSADGLAVKFQLGPCVDVGTGVGLRLSDVKVVYKARPTLAFDENNRCKLIYQDTDDLHVSIGDVNVLGVQNEVDKLGKDAAREAINMTLYGFFSATLRKELSKIARDVCGQVTTGAKPG